MNTITATMEPAQRIGRGFCLGGTLKFLIRKLHAHNTEFVKKA
ncbi:MAG: hypothetical protein NTY01_09905 [Verrucomicrobia bacterium]|nr:hypothetical protein [Verrucomicrobiota bacterium]